MLEPAAPTLIGQQLVSDPLGLHPRGTEVPDERPGDHVRVRRNNAIGRRVGSVREIRLETNRDRGGIALDVIRVVGVDAFAVAAEHPQRAEVDLNRFAEVCYDPIGCSLTTSSNPGDVSMSTAWACAGPAKTTTHTSASSDTPAKRRTGCRRAPVREAAIISRP
ncbi:MAG TPA: hypothetical protein VFD47_01585 [Actinomycetota bacterium]|nr:hypothetical protein [Actinomycetota bacterium]